MSDIDDVRAEILKLRAQVQGDLGAMSRTMARLVQRQRKADAAALERRLAQLDLRGQQWDTRKGSPAEAVPSSTPLVDRLRGDYAVPAGTLDRLSLATVGQLDSDNALELFFQLPGSEYDVYECYIGVAFRQFYATAKAAASGGSSSPTSGSSSSSSSGSSSSASSGASDTSTTGASSDSSSGASSSSTTGASSNTSSGASDTSSSSSSSAASSDTTTGSSASSSSASTTTSAATSHSHRWLNYIGGGPGYSVRRFSSTGNSFDIAASIGADAHTEAAGSGGHDHGMSHTHAHSHGMSHTHAHSHNIAHNHTINHNHGIGHTHDIAHHHNMPHTHNIPHTHDIAHNHTVTLTGHAHDLTFGIYKEAMPVSWSVTLRLYEYVASVWTLRHTAAPMIGLTGEIDLSDYVTDAGMWLVTLQSDAAQPNGGRLSAQLFGTVVGAVRAA